ncbi:predicted protein [Pyrenophora tritici-repentis Pt-1C-BFP]|uniref:Uncharacterized protein n=1 Tax=Pyrenophora tritici-repentis (strain Pt-1C-BFP) TaxID=426418 RepID=B2W7I9_PYRTR|nr:uncharacterized protein PTRG_05777 [Pyrenophora tritici-repentis Pt-1C-BFP]EDU48697.1 predicted protein [Pyrenophora tritici-repentis Pt-1C-BFP]
MVKIQTFILLLGLSLGVSAKNSGVATITGSAAALSTLQTASGVVRYITLTLLAITMINLIHSKQAGKLPGGGGARSCHKSGNPCRKDAWFTDYRDGTPPIYWSDCNLD